MTTVTIAIAAYRAEKNIAKLLNSLAAQSTSNFVIGEILVHCDGREDDTAQIVRRYGIDSSIPVRLIETSPRKGYARAMQTIYTNVSGDILITLNDDIEIQDNRLVDKIVRAFQADSRVGMVTGRPAYLKSRTYFGNALASVQRAYHSSQYEGASRNTAKTVDGKLMAFSRDFYLHFRFPETMELVGNVDCYLYFSVLARGFIYIHAYDAVVYGRNPETIEDYVQFTVRCNISNLLLRKSFDHNLIAREYKRSGAKVAKGLVTEVFRNPLDLVLIFLVNKYILWKVRRASARFSPVWDPVKTARQL